MDILTQLEQFLLAEVIPDLGLKSLDSDEDLLEKGVIDSLGIMKLVLFMEERLDIQVLDEEVVPENFQSLDAMVKFVEQKMRGNT